VPRELDAVDEHRDQVDVIELARDELRELLGRRSSRRSMLAPRVSIDSSTGSKLRS
jgi:hypothetical protein